MASVTSQADFYSYQLKNHFRSFGAGEEIGINWGISRDEINLLFITEFNQVNNYMLERFGQIRFIDLKIAIGFMI